MIAAAQPHGRVLFVGGVWGSGTTLLDLLLGELPGLVAVGELRQLWRSGILEDRRCGCGAAFGACPFWREVGVEAFGGWDRLDAADLAGRQRALDTVWMGGRFALSRSTGARAGPLLEGLARVLTAIRRVSGRSVVVDSSKAPGQAIALRSLPHEDVRLVLVVRDPRAVVFSQQRRAEHARARGDHPGPVVRSWATRWVAYNAMVPRLFPRAARAVTIRYEDLAAEPGPTLELVASSVGISLPPEAFAFVGPDSARLGIQHTVYGNPMRFAVGEVPIRLDDDWVRQMPEGDRRTVARLTAPLLGRYGYRSSSPSRAAGR